MKIFNWVHRRFNHKDGISQNGKKTTEAAALPSPAHEKQYLLQNNGLSSNFFGSWKGGLLTIGTFGYDALSKMDNNCDDVDYDAGKEELISALQQTETINDSSNYYQTSDSEEEEGEEEEEEEEVEEVNPLMYAAYVHDYEGLMEEMKGNDGGVVASSVAGKCGKDEVYLDEYVAAMMKIKMSSSLKRERTTLAELFSADSDEYYSEEIMMQKKQAEGEMAMKQKSSGSKNGKLSFAKKIIGDQDGHPAIHKLNRLMRRMLNRKIHPSDMAVNNVPHPPEHDDNSNNNNDDERKVMVPNCTTRHTHLHC